MVYVSSSTDPVRIYTVSKRLEQTWEFFRRSTVRKFAPLWVVVKITVDKRLLRSEQSLRL